MIDWRVVISPRRDVYSQLSRPRGLGRDGCVCARPVHDTLPRTFPPENEKTTLLCDLIAMGDRTATV